MSYNGEDGGVSTLVNAGGDAISQVDVTAGEVEGGLLRVVGENITFEAKPVAIVFGIATTGFGEVARLNDFRLYTLVKIQH